jgi:hypothetical protein
MPTAAAYPLDPAAAAPPSARRDYSFAAKVAVAAALVALGDWLFAGGEFGASLGLFAWLLLVAMAATRPALLRSRSALVAGGAAALFAVALGDDPSLLAFALFWVAATLAALLPRARFDDGWRWFIRVLRHLVLSLPQPGRDWMRLRGARRRVGAVSLVSRLPVLLLPLAGSLVFLALFATANPLIGDAFNRIDPDALIGGFSPVRLVFWLVLGIAVWSLLRPAGLLPRGAAAVPVDDIRLPGVSHASVTLSLLAFNAIFALQNGLDIAFLWSGAPLPGDLTLAGYAHRGAYPLIATALLTALFVLVTLRPGSALAASPLVRRLVYVWIAQNVLLVASTMLRTYDYVEAYSLTRLRIAAFLWMALVAIGLVLICYRVWRERSGAWLINANLLAAAVLLAGCAFVDFGAAAAAWNVRHTRDVGGKGVSLDLCYLDQLGPSALLPLVEIESQPIRPALRHRVALLRNGQMDRLEAEQANWRTWTFRGARRLARAEALVAARRLPRQRGAGGGCAPPPPTVALTPAWQG